MSAVRSAAGEKRRWQAGRLRDDILCDGEMMGLIDFGILLAASCDPVAIHDRTPCPSKTVRMPLSIQLPRMLGHA